MPPHVGAAAQRGLDTFSRDPGAWSGAAVVAGVVLFMFADLILAADRLSAFGYVRSSSGVGFRARVLVLTSFATLEIAFGLLLGVGLALAMRPSAPAPFRRPVLFGASALALLVVGSAVVRALFLLSFGHAFGLGSFFAAVGAIPVAMVAAALGLVGARAPSETS